MDDQFKKIIGEQLIKIPADIKAAIVSIDYKTKLQEITRRQKLLIDQAGRLETETTLVLLGLEKLGDYVSNLQNELGLPIMRAKEVSLDVSENIFKPIRESLRQMNEGLNEEGGAPATGVPEEVASSPERNKILSEIENPNTIGQNGSMMFTKNPTPATVNPVLVEKSSPIIPTTPKESLSTTTTKSAGDLLDAKLKDTLMIPRNIVEKNEISKLPPVNRPPYKGSDPYKEPTI
ncbi:MAG: hypothetical protein WCO10_01760 [bacterium]